MQDLIEIVELSKFCAVFYSTNFKYDVGFVPKQ